MKVRLFALALASLFTVSAFGNELITNGGFETGDFTGWSEMDQAGGSGSWFVSSSTTSPVSGFATPGPSSGSFYAITDQGGPGSHVLYQDFTIGAGQNVTVSFDLFNNDQAGVFDNPGNLDYTDGPNQHFQVDILGGAADPFTGTVIENLLTGGTPPPSGGTNPWASYSFNISSAVSGGGTFMLRFGEVDNQLYNQLGVDNVSVTNNASTPAPTAILPMLTGLVAIARRRNRR